jgi:hypothetical protein
MNVLCGGAITVAKTMPSAFQGIAAMLETAVARARLRLRRRDPKGMESLHRWHGGRVRPLGGPALQTHAGPGVDGGWIYSRAGKKIVRIRIGVIGAVLAMLAPAVAVAAATGQPAQADIYAQQSASATAAARLVSGLPAGDTLFTNAQPAGCTDQSQNTGTCWWWTAIALNSLVTYAEDHSSDTTTDSKIRADLTSVYQNVCGSSCPNAADESLYAGPFTENTRGNASFDDIGWWTQTWINAYRWTCVYNGGPCDNRYLNLAEGLWYYTTRKGWDTNCHGLMQEMFYVDDTPGPSNPGPTPSQYDDAEANAPYLRNSAWLYTLSGDKDQYMNGYNFSTNTAGGLGVAGGEHQQVVAEH